MYIQKETKGKITIKERNCNTREQIFESFISSFSILKCIFGLDCFSRYSDLSICLCLSASFHKTISGSNLIHSL